jgi:hypothetical protein
LELRQIFFPPPRHPKKVLLHKRLGNMRNICIL